MSQPETEKSSKNKSVSKFLALGVACVALVLFGNALLQGNSDKGAVLGEIEETPSSLTPEEISALSKEVLAVAPRTFKTSREHEQGNVASAQAADAINAFGVELFNKLSDEENGNLLISPYSISSALAMAYLGADGNTAKEMEQFLHFNSKIHSSFSALQARMNSISPDMGTVEVANAVWPSTRLNLLPDYVKRVKEYYCTPILKLDYGKSPEKAADTINWWTSEKTRGKIAHIARATDFDGNTAIALTNAIYFRSKWETGFEEELTALQPFFMENGKKISADLMARRVTSARYYYTGKASLVALPYTGRLFEMIIVLPQKDIALKEVQKDLTSQKLTEWLDSMRFKEVVLYMPKFKQEQMYDLVEVLSAMGVRLPFSAAADFSKISVNLFLDVVRHKTFIEVGEKETEATAVTLITGGWGSTGDVNRPKPIIFRADRPFLYLIRDSTTGMILFIGRYMEPSPVKK